MKLFDSPTPTLDDDTLSRWQTIPAAIISDELGRGATMLADLSPLAPGASFAGQALTVRTMVGDNAPLHYALTVTWPGCVVVVDGRGHVDTALWGGILNTCAVHRGVAAVVVDGAARDAAQLRESGIPVYARGIVPNGPQKGTEGAINGPIQCAGVPVGPGDLLVGDDDGVVVIPPPALPGLLERCRARIAKEDEFVRRIAAGATTADLLGLPPLG